MDPSAFLSAGADLGSSVISGLFGAHSAKKSMQFQERMSSTAYQRAAKDLEAAGLNRILALGSPASTPSGATAVMPDSKPGSSYQAAASARSQRLMQDEQIKLLREQQVKTYYEGEAASAQKENIEADTAVKLGNSTLFPAMLREITERTGTYKPQISLLGQTQKLQEEQTRLAGADADAAQWRAKKFTALNPFLDMLIQDVLNPLASGARDVLNTQKGSRSWFQQGGLKFFKDFFNIR